MDNERFNNLFTTQIYGGGAIDPNELKNILNDIYTQIKYRHNYAYIIFTGITAISTLGILINELIKIK